MSLSQSVAKNTILQSGGKLIGLILSLISAGMIFPYLGEAGVGKYTAILSLLQVFGIMMDFGLYIVLIKRLSDKEADADSQVNAIFTLRLLSGIIFLSLAPLTAWIIGQYSSFYSSEIILGVGLTTLFFLFVSLNQLLSAIFQKFLRTGWIALAELIGKLVLLVMSIAVIVYDLNLLWVMSTLVISSGINFFVMCIASRQYFKIRLSMNWSIWKSVLKDAWPIGISIAFALLYFKGDTVILTFYETEEVIGEYGAPYKILEVLITFPAIFTGLVLPTLTAAWKEKQQERFQIVLQKSFDLLSSIAVPMVVGTAVLAPYLMSLLVPTGFEQSDQILRILMIATGSIFLGTLFGYAVPALDKQRTMMWGYIVIAIVSLVAYLLVIPRYSITGAAWITVFSEVSVLCVAMSIVLYTTRTKLRFLPFLKILCSAVIMGIVLYFITPSLESFLYAHLDLSVRFFSIILLSILVPVGIIIYMLAILLTKAFEWNDIKKIVLKRSV